MQPYRAAALFLALLQLASCGQGSAEKIPTPRKPAAADPTTVWAALPASVRGDAEAVSCATSLISTCVAGPISKSAVSAGDPAMCDAIPAKAQKDSCKAEVASQNAIRAADLEPCSHAGDANAAAQCKMKTAQALAASTGETSWCDKAGSGRQDAPADAAAAVCLIGASALVPAEKAGAYCERIAEQSLKLACRASLASRKAMARPGPGAGSVAK